MKLDERIDRMSWKNIIILIIALFFAATMVRHVLMFNTFHHAFNSVVNSIAREEQRMAETKAKFEKNDQAIKREFDQAFNANSKLIDEALQNSRELNRHEQ